MLTAIGLTGATRGRVEGWLTGRTTGAGFALTGAGAAIFEESARTEIRAVAVELVAAALADAVFIFITIISKIS